MVIVPNVKPCLPRAPVVLYMSVEDERTVVKHCARASIWRRREWAHVYKCTAACLETHALTRKYAQPNVFFFNVFAGLWSDPSDHPANAQWLRENVAFSRNGRGGDGLSARAYGGTWSR